MMEFSVLTRSYLFYLTALLQLLAIAAARTTLGDLSRYTGEQADALHRQAGNLEYNVAVCDQFSRSVHVFPRNASSWKQDASDWSFKVASSDWQWAAPTDLRIRRVAHHGWIALLTSSGGTAGIINVTKKEVKTQASDFLWTASPGDNPHAIDRIPYHGAVIVASSDPGKLSVYVPADPDNINNYKKLKKGPTYQLSGAHGVLWDPNGSSDPSKGFLWAANRKTIVRYKVKGNGTHTRLVRRKKFTIPGKGLGHDLQPDFTDKNTLLVTDTYGAYAFNKSNNKWKRLKKQRKLKSLVRSASGEYVWVSGNKDEMGQYVRFGGKLGDTVTKKGWGGARFYKARIFHPAFE